MDKTMKTTNDTEIQQLIETLASKNGIERKNAREQLVASGIKTIDHLKEFIAHPKHLYRWEALKTMQEIGSPVSIPFYIQALDDDESDIRWIAAESLIKLGQQSVKPLLERLVEKKDSIFVLSGAHHVFYDLNKENSLPTEFPIKKMLHALKTPELAESIKILAFDILKSLDS